MQDNNRVTVRLWKSQGSNSMGHVSLETHSNVGLQTASVELCPNTPAPADPRNFPFKRGAGIYASFWPTRHGHKEHENARQSCLQEAHIYEKSHFHTVEDDMAAEGKDADDENTIALYGLDIAAINQTFAKTEKKKTLLWSLLPHISWLMNRAFLGVHEQENCCTLAHKLLKAGDTNHRINLIDPTSKRKWITVGVSATSTTVLLSTFNAYGKFMPSYIPRSQVNLGGALLFWVMTAQIVQMSLNFTRKRTILTPESVFEAAKNSDCRKT